MASQLDRYMQALLDLLPPGPVWDLVDDDIRYLLLETIAEEMCRQMENLQERARQANPLHATIPGSLEQWEEVLGLPSACLVNPTLEDRQAAVKARFLGKGTNSPRAFLDLATSLGFSNTVVEKGVLPGSRLTQRLGFRLQASGPRFQILITTDSQTPQRNALFECLANEILDAYPELVFTFRP